MEKREPGPTTTDLLEVAAAEEHEVTARSLELWRYRGLLPRPRREAGGRAIWRYPNGTQRQLERLLHWRERTRSHGEILVALWVEGFPVELVRLRAALSDFVGKWSKTIERETGASSQEGERALVDRLARKLARMRGKGAPFPHCVRMRLSDRERAFGYMVAAMFGMREELERREEDVPHLERMLGMRTGHGGGLSAELGLIDPAGDVTRMPTPAQARAAVEEATPAELEMVRRVLQMLVAWLPLAIPMLLPEQAAKSVHLLDLVRELFGDPSPALFSFLTAALLVLLQTGQLPGLS